MKRFVARPGAVNQANNHGRPLIGHCGRMVRLTAAIRDCLLYQVDASAGCEIQNPEKGFTCNVAERATT